MLRKEEVDQALFQFHEAIYHYEKQEEELYGLNWDEVYILQCVKRSPGILLIDLGEKMRLKNFMISRKVTRLLELNLLRREQQEADKRRFPLFLTKQSEEKLAAIEEHHYQTILAGAGQFSADDMRLILHHAKHIGTLLNVDERITK